MAHEEEDDSSKIGALQIISKLASSLGQKVCEMYVVCELGILAEDSSFKVRKFASETICKVGSVVTFQCFQARLSNHFLNLSKDSIWGVRKSAA